MNTKSKSFSDQQKENVFDPRGKKILAISAHPDDLDFLGVGAIIDWLAKGAKAAIVIATNGDKGAADCNLSSNKLAKMRHKEQLEASEALGLETTWFLDYPDAHLEVTQDLKAQLVRIIRMYRPDVVMTFDPTMIYSRTRNYINHPDHIAVGHAALNAIFPMARDFLTFPQHKALGLEPHKVTDVFLYNYDNPNFSVDITKTLKQKLAILALHKSQIDMERIDPFIREWNEDNGKAIGAKYAECFVHVQLK